MAKKTASVPLIKQSLEQIIATARLGGFNIARDRHGDGKPIGTVWLDLRSSWIDENLPNALGTMDDDAFGEVLVAAADAFEEGIDSYLTAQKQKFIADTKTKQRAALKRAQNDGESFSIEQLRSFALSGYTETLPEQYEGQSEEDFDAFILEATAEFERGFNRAYMGEAATAERLDDIEDDTKTLASIFIEIIGIFNAIGRLEKQAPPGYRDFEIAALATVGVGLGDSGHFILGAPPFHDKGRDPAPVARPSQREHENA